MKKNILLTLAMAVICLHNLLAQDSKNLSAAVARSFANDFSGASNVKSESLPKGITLVQFNLDQRFWLAYYNEAGSLITSGRRVKVGDKLPVRVEESLDRLRAKYEQKYGTLAVGAPFEMTKGSVTEYFVPMKNAQIDMLVSIDSFGSSIVQNKQIHKSPIEPEKSVIAKKN